MPAGPADIGIKSATPALLQSIEWEGALSDTGPRMDGEGKFANACAFDLLVTGSLTSLGTLATDLGVAATGIEGLDDGVAVFTEKSHDQVQDNYDETTLNFEWAPEAETGEEGGDD